MLGDIDTRMGLYNCLFLCGVKLLLLQSSAVVYGYLSTIVIHTT